MKKLTYEYIKEQIEKKGYKLISKEYINNSTKLDLKCPNGHEYKASWGTFKQGHGCLICYNKRRGLSIKLTYEFVKEQIEKEGYKLLSKEYKKSRDKLYIECPLGHKYKATYASFYMKQRCPKCSIETIKNKLKLTYEYVKEQIEKERYKLLSKEYINCMTELKVKCKKGHIYKVKYNTFQQGGRCLICSGKKKHSYDFIKQEIEKEGYKLLSSNYKNNKQLLKIKCKEGHEYKVKWNDFMINTKRKPTNFSRGMNF